MLTAEGCASRRRRLWESLGDGCEALLVADPMSLIYLANFALSPFVFRSSDAGAVLILRPDSATLVTDSMVRSVADRAHVDEVVAPTWYDGKHAAPHRKALLARSAREVLAGMAGTRFGVEAGSLPAGVLEGRPGVTTVPIDDAIRRQRRVKDEDEVAMIRRSARAGEAGHAAALREIRPGMTELDAYRLVANAAGEAAGEQVLVYGDFVSGPRVEAEQGGAPSGRIIEAGDLFLLDYSVVVRGYRADFTNTFVVGGKPSDGQRRLFDACLKALGRGEAALRAGVPARSIDEAVRGSIAAAGLLGSYPSHTGHGLGLSHPEPPYFVPESDETVLAGDVVAIEPGLFEPGVGGMRFERNYLVTADGFETLTHHRLTLEP